MGESAASQASRIVDLLKDESWEVRSAAAEALGNMGESAASQASRIGDLLKDENSAVRSAAAWALVKMGESAASQASRIVDLLKDENWQARYAAAEALGNMGESAASQASRIGDLLKDEDGHVRSAAAAALGKMAPREMGIVLGILNSIEKDPEEINRRRFLAHYLAGEDSASHTAVYWLGRPQTYPEKVSREEGTIILNAFDKAWGLSRSLKLNDLQEDLEKQIARVIRMTGWQEEDLNLLNKHLSNLQAVKSTHADAVENEIVALQGKRWFSYISRGWLLHALFWLLLIFVYPKSPQVQAIFFWNPWVRRIMGLGYIGFLLTWVPYLRRKLFAPFRESLLADAALDTFNPRGYFVDSEVRNESSGEVKPFPEAIPEVRGQIVLQGESGLGKSMFLRHMALRSNRTVVFLPADKCAGGVIEAIQTKLHGLAQTSEFLRNLIYSGAVDIYIDGLNEVSADTRAKVAEFAERYFKGNIIMATQPLEWRPPSTARVYTLLPLKREKIEQFLLSRKDTLPEDAAVGGADYERICREFLARELEGDHPKELRESIQRVLSNPMDLTLTAQMISRGQTPDLFHLQEQQYKLMAADYRRIHTPGEFPLKIFAEEVYQMRLSDTFQIPENNFPEALKCMERHKMVYRRELKNAERQPITEWYFRHDKIMEYFIVQTFLGENNEQPETHIGDPRFSGVYFLLALLLPFEEAQTLERKLIDYAADRKDHTVSDRFIQLLRTRQVS